MAKRMLSLATAVALVWAVALLLAGCGPLGFQNVGDLLQAPALGQGQDAIQDALAAYLGVRPQFKYPRMGAWRSPLYRADLDGNGRDEAVLLYRLPEESDAAAAERSNNVYVAVLAQVDGAWTVMCTEEGRGVEVVSIEAADLLGDGSRQLLLGYGTATLASKTLAIYTYQENALALKHYSMYSTYLIDDFTGRGGGDLLVVSAADTLGGLRLQHVPVMDGQLATDALPTPVALDENFISCEGITPSMGPQGTRLLVIDGRQASGVLFSQLVNYNGEDFYTQNPNQLRGATVRHSLLLKSRDINGDRRAEIPLRLQSGGSITTLAGDKRLEYIEWMDFITRAPEEPVARQYGMLDADRSVYIRLPEGWRGAVDVEDGEEPGEWEMRERRTRRALLALRVLEPGVTPPVGAVRVPGTVSSYLVYQAGLTEPERNLIVMVALA